MITLYCFATQLLNQIVDLVLRMDLIICKYHAIESARIRNNAGGVEPNVSNISDGVWCVPLASNVLLVRWHSIIIAARRKARECRLIPPANINTRVREV